jgi:galactitol PTS system EIIA component
MSTFGALLDPRCVATNVECRDDTSVIRYAASLLARIGAVTAHYAEAAVERERVFPTGLPTEPIGVAIPHTDQGVVAPAIAVLTLREPVPFLEMGTGEREIPVTVVMMLALEAGSAHVEALGTLAEMIQRPGFLDKVAATYTAAELYQTFQAWFAPTDAPV